MICGLVFAVLDAGHEAEEIGLNAVARGQQRRGVGRRLQESHSHG